MELWAMSDLIIVVPQVVWRSVQYAGSTGPAKSGSWVARAGFVIRALARTLYHEGGLERTDRHQ
jgi:hypothetical protein